MSTLQLTLFRGWDEPGVYVWSPFVTKLEARLRFAGLKYKPDSGSVQKSPKGKIPYVEIIEGEEGNPRLVSDSSLVIGRLVEDGILEDLNTKLSPVDKAHDLALRALIEDKWYFYQACEKWYENYETMRDHILWKLSWPAQVLTGLLMYRNVNATLRGQGAARFTPEEQAQLGQEIWDNVEVLLVASKAKHSGGGPFWALGGNDPSEADTTLFGAISASLVTTVSPKSTKIIKDCSTVMDYAKRIHDRYFPDYVLWE